MNPQLLDRPTPFIDVPGCGRRIQRKDNKELIEKYKKAYDGRKPPLQTIKSDSSATVPNVRYGLYYMRPPAVSAIHENNDHHYGNGLSLLLYLRHGNQNILIPGDVTPEVHKEILKGGKKIERRFTYFCNVPDGTSTTLHEKNGDQPVLESVLKKQGLSVLIAPHHGLESCYCQELFDTIKDGKPQINVLSEKRHRSENDGKVDARYHGKDNAKGVTVDIDGTKEKRYSVSTASGKHILCVFKGTDSSPHIFLRKKPEDLLAIVP